MCSVCELEVDTLMLCIYVCKLYFPSVFTKWCLNIQLSKRQVERVNGQVPGLLAAEGSLEFSCGFLKFLQGAQRNVKNRIHKGREI